ncbi:MAG: hypothetical protein K2P78_06275 [Gemmataceae bacterium]|nr:hypothetical protein [Gemmataceae bacterium]
MNPTSQLAMKWPHLTEEQQRKVLEFIETLQPARKAPLIDLYGLFAGNVTTEEDIAEARREMWGNFPREVF